MSTLKSRDEERPISILKSASAGAPKQLDLKRSHSPPPPSPSPSQSHDGSDHSSVRRTSSSSTSSMVKEGESEKLSPKDRRPPSPVKKKGASFSLKKKRTSGPAERDNSSLFSNSHGQGSSDIISKSRALADESVFRARRVRTIGSHGGRLENTSQPNDGQDEPERLTTSAPPPKESGDNFLRDGQRRVMRSGSIDDLIKSFLDEAPDVTTAKHLILAHRQFVPSLELMSVLIKYYTRMGIQTSDSPSSTAAKSLRFLNLMKSWIQVDIKGLMADEKAYGAFKNFMARLQTSNDSIYGHLHGILENRVANLGMVSLDSHKDSGENYNFLEFKVAKEDMDELAQQLSLFEHKLLSLIRLEEFYDSAWSKERAPNIAKISKFSNNLSHALILHILGPSKPKSQLIIWSKVAMLGKALSTMYNFNSLLAVYLALQNPIIDQLAKDHREWMSNKATRWWKEISELMNPLNNFAAYRIALGKTEGAFVPCPEVHLKDLLYISEQYSNWVDEENRVLNLTKLDSMGKIISIFYDASRLKYTFDEKSRFQSSIASILDLKLEVLQERIETASLRMTHEPDSGTDEPENFF